MLKTAFLELKISSDNTAHLLQVFQNQKLSGDDLRCIRQAEFVLNYTCRVHPVSGGMLRRKEPFSNRERS